MALPLTQAARALAEDYRQQSMQIQTLIESNMFIAALGFVDQTQYRFELPRSLLPAHENALTALVKAKSELHVLADLLDLWANDVERAVLEAVHSAASRESRNTRQSEPY